MLHLLKMINMINMLLPIYQQEILLKSVLNGNMYCGKNYTRNGNSNSVELANRLISDDKIVCNSIYNVEASLNINNETINSHMPKFGDTTDIDGYINYLTSTLPDETHLDFSVEECNVNHCKWPTIQYDDNIVNNYLLPPIRIDVPDGYGGDETSNILKNLIKYKALMVDIKQDIYRVFLMMKLM